jgi:hypothetical protein
MQRIKKYLPWTFRIIVFLLFALSAVTKMFPIWAFEKQLVDLGLTDWCSAPFWARLIIATELTLGIGMLQPHFLRRIIIPATFLLLTAFSVHLTIEMVKHGPMNGNCGCFGQLIPMTPLEAFIKNILTMGLLVYLYRTVQDRQNGPNRISPLVMLFLGSALLMFAAFPFCPCPAESETTPQLLPVDSLATDTTVQQIDSFALLTDTSTTDSVSIASKPGESATPAPKPGESATPAPKPGASPTPSPTPKPLPKPIDPGPKPIVSKFAKYTTFGTRTINLDQGKKIVCMFAPGCDHCRATAKEICTLARQIAIPEVYILFMDEDPDAIPAFFQEAGCTYPHQIIKIPEFWTLLGASANTPGVFYLWNGNVIKLWEGIDANAFDAKGLRGLLGG